MCSASRMRAEYSRPAGWRMVVCSRRRVKWWPPWWRGSSRKPTIVHLLSSRAARRRWSFRFGNQALCIVAAVRCWGHLANFLEYPTKISHITVSALGGDLFQSHSISLQHELGAAHADKVEIVIKPHETFLPK